MVIPVGSRVIARWIVAGVVAALFVGTAPLVAESKSGPSNVDPALLAAAKANPNALFPVIVRGTPSAAAFTKPALAKVGVDQNGKGNEQQRQNQDETKSRVKRAETALSTSTADGVRQSLAIVGGASGALHGWQIVDLSRSPNRGPHRRRPDVHRDVER